jgi:hypothetical protein
MRDKVGAAVMGLTHSTDPAISKVGSKSGDQALEGLPGAIREDC